MKKIESKLKRAVAASLLAAATMLSNSGYAAADTYSNFAAMTAHEVLGTDYRIEAANQGSSLTVLAIHGGGIEVGTSQLAEAVAELGGYNYYSLRGLLRSGNSILHITSTHFDDPCALEMVANSTQTISIHGYSGAEEATYIGGLDLALGTEIAKSLAAAGFAVKSAPGEIAGTNPYNIANRNLSGKGVQLEITRGLRDAFLASRGQETGSLSRYAAAVNLGVLNYNAAQAKADSPNLAL